jgi:hypothetical protein
MAFTKTGVVTAPKIVPSAFGLLAVVKPENGPNEDQWIRGFSQEWETTLYSATNWDDSDSSDGEVVAAGTPTYYTEIKPFFIEAEELRSTLGFNGLDRIERLKRQIEGVTQHAMEIELWDGAVRIGESHANRALISDGLTLINGTTALSPRRALALLEHSIGLASDGGEQGVIHMTRDVAALLASNSNMLFHESGVDHLQTLGGTPVIVGSGYSGNGPLNDQSGPLDDGIRLATASNKWIYATGTVRTYVGDVDVVNDNLAQAYDVSGNQNDMRLKAIRPAAVYFDTSIHLAVRVDLTA